MNYEKLLAGLVAGIGAIILILQGYITEGSIILSGMMGFFIGDQNGSKEATKAMEKALTAVVASEEKKAHETPPA